MEKNTLTNQQIKAKNKRIAKRRRIKKTSKITYTILLLLTIVLFFIIKGFQILPGYALAILGGLLALLLVPLAYIAFIPAVKNGAKQGQSILCLLLSVLVLFGCIKLPAYKGALEKAFVKIPSEGELNIVVYTLKQDGASQLVDLANQKVAIQQNLDQEYQNYAIKVLNKELKDANGSTIVPVETQSIYQAVDLLYEKEVAAILLNESYAKMIQDNNDYRDFAEKTQKIYTCTQKITLNVNTTTVSNLTKEPFIIALTGVDEWDLASLEPTATPRSDVNMLVAVNPTTSQILILTIPRDSYVPIIRSNEIIGYDKLTHFTTFTNGMNLWIQTLSDLLAVDINYYLRVNFLSVKDIVDSLGGIDLNNPYEFSTQAVAYVDEQGNVTRNEFVTFPQGMIHLNGAEALGYCRERYSLPNMDMDRNKHQALMIKACIKKLCSVSMITKVEQLLKSAESKFTTNLQMNDIYALAQMQLDEMKDWEIVQYSLIGTTQWADSYAVGDVVSVVELSQVSIHKAQQYLQQLLHGDKVVIE